MINSLCDDELLSLDYHEKHAFEMFDYIHYQLNYTITPCILYHKYEKQVLKKYFVIKLVDSGNLRSSSNIRNIFRVHLSSSREPIAQKIKGL